jgi:hypothetical protein
MCTNSAIADGGYRLHFQATHEHWYRRNIRNFGTKAATIVRRQRRCSNICVQIHASQDALAAELGHTRGPKDCDQKRAIVAALRSTLFCEQRVNVVGARPRQRFRRACHRLEEYDVAAMRNRAIWSQLNSLLTNLRILGSQVKEIEEL